MAGAIFDWTRCENTDFSKANLAGARFFHSSDLKGAKFILANLAGATFSHVKLEEVDFTGARLVGTIFEYTDLSSAKIPFATMLAAVEGGTQFEQVEFGAWNRLKYTGAHTVSAAKKLWNKTNTYLETVDA